MSADKIFGSDRVIGAALMSMGIAYLPELTANYSSQWSQHECALLKKRFSQLFRNGVAVAAIVVDLSGNQYQVKTMDELIRVWRKAGIRHSFDMTQKAFESIKDEIVLHPIPELATV